MPLLDDIKDFLVAQDVPAGVVAGDIFLGSIPKEEDGDIIALYRSAGLKPSMLGDTRSPNLQVSVRSLKSLTATTQINEIFTLLSSIGNEFENAFPEGVTINGRFYPRFDPVQDIFQLGDKDEKGRYIFVQNYIATFFN